MNSLRGQKNSRPVVAVQFGEGNFLRAFFDWMADIAIEKGTFSGGIAVVKPREGALNPAFAQQGNAYTVLLRGLMDGKRVDEARVVRSIETVLSPYSQYADFLALARGESLRFIVSNTSDAGIAYDPADEALRPSAHGDSAAETIPASFPAKLTRFLYERFRAFSGAGKAGLTILPMELSEEPGPTLQKYCLRYAEAWDLGGEFCAWLKSACRFRSTLVDRIVTGYPAEEADALEKRFGYSDALLVAAEPYAQWVIEGRAEEFEALGFAQAGLPVVFIDDLFAYKNRKVRILNGAHTGFALLAYLCGHDFVREAILDPPLRAFVERLLRNEVLPTIDMPRAQLEGFMAAVLERFENPYIRHALLSIALNSAAKFRARCLPTLIDCTRRDGHVPACFAFSFAALLQFYTGWKTGEHTLAALRGGVEYTVSDDAAVIDACAQNSGLPAAGYVRALMERADIWGGNLTELPGFYENTVDNLEKLRTLGARAALSALLEAEV